MGILQADARIEPEELKRYLQRRAGHHCPGPGFRRASPQADTQANLLT